jgi:hypothetical protein
MVGDYQKIYEIHIKVYIKGEIMETLKMIFTEKTSDYKIVDVILKAWISGLLVLWVIGMVAIISHIIMNPSAVDNATFGIFDTLGN